MKRKIQLNFSTNDFDNIDNESQEQINPSLKGELERITLLGKTKRNLYDKITALNNYIDELEGFYKKVDEKIDYYEQEYLINFERNKLAAMDKLIYSIANVSNKKKLNNEYDNEDQENFCNDIKDPVNKVHEEKIEKMLEVYKIDTEKNIETWKNAKSKIKALKTEINKINLRIDENSNSMSELNKIDEEINSEIDKCFYIHRERVGGAYKKSLALEKLNSSLTETIVFQKQFIKNECNKNLPFFVKRSTILLRHGRNIKKSLIKYLFNGPVGDKLWLANIGINTLKLWGNHKFFKPYIKLKPITYNNNVERYSLFDCKNKVQQKAKQLLTNNIPKNFELGMAIAEGAIAEGDSFYDAAAQALNQLQLEEEYSIKSLRRFCKDYADIVNRKCNNNWQHENNWLGQLFENQDEYHDYLTNVEYTAQECNQDNRLVIWGKQHIDAVILCKKLNIKIHIIEVQTALADGINANQANQIMIHRLVDANGSSVVNEINYNDEHECTIHLALYNNHFAPLLRKLKQEQEVRLCLDQAADETIEKYKGNCRIF